MGGETDAVLFCDAQRCQQLACIAVGEYWKLTTALSLRLRQETRRIDIVVPMPERSYIHLTFYFMYKSRENAFMPMLATVNYLHLATVVKFQFASSQKFGRTAIANR